MGNGRLIIQNRFLYTDLKNYNFKWELLKNGDVAASGTLQVSLPAGSSKEVKLPLPALQQESGAEYLLNVYAYTKYPSEMIPEGHEVAREQFVLNGNSYFAGQSMQLAAIDMKEENNVLFFTCGDVRISFNKRNGELNGYRYQDKMLLEHTTATRILGARLPIMISVTAWVFFAMFGVLPDKTRSSKA